MKKFIKKTSELFEKYFGWIIAAIGALQVWMISGMTIYQYGDAIQDNMLMVQYASSLGAGQWLGEYNNNTLVKRIAYPAFLALCDKLNLPYLTGLGILWTLSVVVFIIAISKQIRKKINLFIIYIILLFNPVMYSVTFATAIYRNSIVPSGVILAVATLIGLYYRRKEKKITILRWSLYSGLAFAFFWNIREDSIWLLPFYCGALFLTSIFTFFGTKEKKQAIIKIVIICISILTFLEINTSIKLKNYYEYGIYTDTELFDTNCAKLKSMLKNLHEDEEYDGSTVSKSTVEMLYKVSPTFSLLEPYMGPNMYYTFWQVIGDGKDDGEVYGDYFFWGLRDVIQAAGYYKDGKTANEFYGKVCNEIQTAIDTGKLYYDDNGLMFKGVKIFGEDMSLVIETMYENIDLMLNYENISYKDIMSSGNITNLRRTELITGNNIIYPYSVKKSLKGTITLENISDDLQVQILDENDKFIDGLPLYKDNNVYNFEYETNRSSNLYFAIIINGKIIEKIDCKDGFIGTYDKGKYTLIMNENYTEVLKEPFTDILNSTHSKKYNSFINVYKITGNAFAILSFIAMIITIVIGIKRLVKREKVDVDMILIVIGLVLSYFILIFGVSANYYAAIDGAKMWGYLAGICPLQSIIELLAIFTAVELFIEEVKKIKDKKKVNCN